MIFCYCIVIALHLPHLHADGMVGTSYKLAESLYRCYRIGKFLSFNNSDKRKNIQQFGDSNSIDIGKNYYLINIPIHITAGNKDGVISPENVVCHYHAMKEAGVDVTYREFDSGHLEFRANESRELRKYVLQLLVK